MCCQEMEEQRYDDSTRLNAKVGEKSDGKVTGFLD